MRRRWFNNAAVLSMLLWACVCVLRFGSVHEVIYSGGQASVTTEILGHPVDGVLPDCVGWIWDAPGSQFLLIALLALPLLWLIRGRDTHDLCPACGYDLRATPLRCPECGR